MLGAGDLPALLGAAYRAFERALQALRSAEDQAGPLLPAFVLAAAAAANGRDAVAAAPSFRGPGATPAGNLASAAATDLADQVAGLSFALGHAHLNCLGRYAFTTQPPAELRPLRDPNARDGEDDGEF